MCSYDGDAADLWIELERTARKPWICIECHAPIPVGVTYACIKTLMDGRWHVDQAHKECMKLWRKVQKELCGNRGMIMLGGLDEELSQDYDAGGHNEYDFRLQKMVWKSTPSPAPYRRRLNAIRAKYLKMAAAD